MTLFPKIERLDDVLPHVEHKREIMLMRGAGDSYILCYLFVDNATFDSPQARECRGIAFDRDGKLVARPLHKFFNVGEKPATAREILPWHDATRVMEKLDGSMIHTAWMYDRLWLKSRKSFSSHVVKMAWAHLDRPEHAGVREFCARMAKAGYTAIFELTSPNARIVMPYETTEMRLLHIRENVTGAYLPLGHFAAEIAAGDVQAVAEQPLDALLGHLDSVPALERGEGCVIQFRDGEMVKAKSAWYLRLHRCVALMRQRDIAEAALAGQLDDIKAALREIGANLAAVEAIETAVKARLIDARAAVEDAVGPWLGNPDRKALALAMQDHPLFGLIMTKYTGREPHYVDWYRKRHLRDEWSIDPVDGFVVDDP